MGALGTEVRYTAPSEDVKQRGGRGAAACVSRSPRPGRGVSSCTGGASAKRQAAEARRSIQAEVAFDAAPAAVDVVVLVFETIGLVIEELNDERWALDAIGAAFAVFHAAV